MGFRFRRSIKLLPGLRVNLSKSGISTSIGRPGMTVNIRGRRTTTTVGIPGTGLSYRTSSTPRRTPHSEGDTAAAGPQSAQVDGDHAHTSSEPQAAEESGNLAIWFWLIAGAVILWLAF